MQRLAPYAWQCLACAEPNASLGSHCARCACPAYVTVKQVELSQQQLQPQSTSGASLPKREATVLRILAAGFLAVGLLLTTSAAPLAVFALGVLAVLAAALFWRLGAQASNPSIERTIQSLLRSLWPAAHVER